MSDRLSVFLVDDHDIVRAGMRAVLADSFDIVGEAADVAESISGRGILIWLTLDSDCHCGWRRGV